jgi:molybdate transport system substrate-binding protein
MAAVIEAGRIEPGAAVNFVSNRLAIIVPSGNPAGIESIEDLARPGVLLILAVEGVPVRAYADEIAAALGPEFQAGFYANLASEEDNVRQVAAKVALGEADAGIVYTSDVTPDLAGLVQQIEIPPSLNVAAEYPIAALADAPSPETARAFIEFVLGPAGQAILARWGFGPPTGN